MDIDEFLDRELADLGNGATAADTISGNAGRPFKDMSMASALSGDAMANLAKSDLDGAEDSYNNLWHVLMQQNIKWDLVLYEHLSGLSRQFSSTLAKAYDEMKNKAGMIYELTGKARIFLKEGKKDMALKIYSQVQEISNSVPNVFFQEKRSLQEQVASLYREIISATDAELIRKVSDTLQEINKGIDRINSCIMSNDIENASADYIKCIGLYNQIPEGFLKDKNPAGMRLLGIYRGLSISREITSLQKMLGQQKIEIKQPVKTFTKPNIPISGYPGQQPPARKYAARGNKTGQKPDAHPLKEISKPYVPERYSLLSKKREHAKKNIKKGFYNEAWKNIEEALQMDPNDVESKALRAKIKTLQ